MGHSALPAMCGEVKKIFLMKKLELNEMQNFMGGAANPSSGVITAVDVACVGVGLLALGGAFFTFGASLAAGTTIAGAFCTGWGLGNLLVD